MKQVWRVPTQNGEFTNIIASHDWVKENYEYYEFVSEELDPPTHTINNEVVTVNENPAMGLGNVYYAAPGDSISLSADIVDGDGNVQTQIDQTALGYPPVLKMPIVEMLNGELIGQSYLTVTLANGTLTATGVVPRSGDWKITQDRVNASLAAIGADWQVEMSTKTFLV